MTGQGTRPPFWKKWFKFQTQEKKMLDQYLDEVEIKPTVWDGFGFVRDSHGTLRFFYFDDMAKECGIAKKDQSIPEDRDPYYVILTSVRKGVFQIESPFLSNFIDPFVYAKTVSDQGFSGFMYRQGPHAGMMVSTTILDLMERGRSLGKFIYNDNGTPLTIGGEHDPA